MDNHRSQKDDLLKRTAKLEKELAARSYALKIESALEKVSVAAMSMRKSKDLSGIGSLIFKELRKLGFIDLRNTEIVINNDAKETITSYYYSDYGVTGVIELNYRSNPIVQGWAKKMKKASDAFAKVIIREKEMKQWRKYREEMGYEPDPKLNKAKTVYYYSYSTGLGALSISSFKPVSTEQIGVLGRFRNVFQLAYQRYADITLAAAQAREAEIELAMERVRARTMAMQKSDELAETTFVLFQQLKVLGETAAQLSIGIIKEEQGIVELSTTIHGSQLLQTYPVPVNDPYFMKKVVEPWKAKQRTLTVEIKGKQLKEYNKWRNSILKKKIVFPEKQWIINVVFFSKGMISFSSDRHIPQGTIQLLERFAGVFDLTYTRFLDLQRAESQAREAQVEAALEKVRARSLAMHKSDELSEASAVLFHELTKLGIQTTRSGFGIYYEREHVIRLWLTANAGDQSVRPVSGNLPLSAYRPVMNNYKAWKEGKAMHIQEFVGSAVKDYYHKISSYLSLALQEQYPERLVFSVFFFNEGSLNVVTERRLTEEECAIMVRFANVFGFAYTRFLDLQKAEAQAREAQIEAALERVRASSMAMHQSHELNKVIKELTEQLALLGFDFDASNITTDLTSAGLYVWNASPAQPIPSGVYIPYKDIDLINWIYSDWGVHEGVKTDTFNKAQKNAFFKHYFTHTRASNISEERKKYILDAKSLNLTFACRKDFALGLVNYRGIIYTGEQDSILARFAKIFEQSYIRFLDLQTAEAQAREAQIEAALERVRSKTMAMHSSTDVGETVAIMFDEVVKLGIQSIRCGIGIMDKEENMEVWTARQGDKGKVDLIVGHLDMTKHPLRRGMYEGWRNKAQSFSYELKGDDLVNYFTLINDARDYPIHFDIHSLSSQQFHNSFYFPEGAVFVFGAEPLPGESSKIFKRVAAVFGQTYRRYLDLLRAEGQARDAQIEAAMERVRSRTMAMHHTSELQEVIHTVHKELLNLNLSIEGGSFVVINDDVGPELRCWGSCGTANTSEEVRVPHFDMPFCTDLIKGIKKGPGFFTEEFSQQEKKDYFTQLFQHKPWSDLRSKQKKETLSASGGYTRSVAVSKHTSVFIINHHGKKFTEDENSILKRFAKVFEQTYTRFLDLQKAEAQAREAQIQLALERVRARTMAMHKSEELAETAHVVFRQLQELGGIPDRLSIGIVDEAEGVINFWQTDQVGSHINNSFKGRLDERTVMSKAYQAWKGHKKSLVIELHGETLQEWLQVAREEMSITIKELIKDCRVHNVAFFSHGWVVVTTNEPQSTETIQILERFASVFDLTYRRFLDLQKAEAQAREAQIEAALEKVRSRTMGMQKSEELKEVIQVVYEQFVHLNILVEHAGFIIDYKERDDMHIWLADKHAVPFRVIIPYFDCAHWNSFNEAREKGTDFFANHLSFEEKNRFYQDLFKLVPVTDEAKEYYFNCPGLAISTALLENVGLYIENFSGIPYSDEENNVLMRFGKVFQQTYTRFIDLQRAEAQAREGQIEAVLERIRSQSLAMHHSDELMDVIIVMFKKLNELKVLHGTVAIQLFDYQTKDSIFWAGNNFQSEPQKVSLPCDEKIMTEDTCHRDLWDAMTKKEIIFNKVYSKEQKDKWFEYVFAKNDLSRINSATREIILGAEIHTVCFIPEKHSALFADSWDGSVYTDDELNVLKRAAKVFEQAYVRFLDLQKAEAQAKEAQIEAALERVRSRTLAMQRSDELAETASVLFRQLILLGIEPNRLFISIIKDEKGKAEFWVTDEDGIKVSTAYTANLNDNPSFKKMHEGWKEKRKSMMIDMQGKELEEFFKHLSGLDVPFKRGKRRLEYIAYFAKGFIGMASPDEQPAETIQLLERFAAVFNLTFTRFNDLKIAEAHALKAERDLIEIKAARKHAEEALVKLQATQKQLVQSEKMASLGELTAGIAHEIQNPLNFVNNFSEVNRELIEELKSQKSKLKSEEQDEILNDIDANLGKIAHHGKRADAIVKGMLQHSRTSSGQKELTDINALADEYLRLAYHGLRAKDKSFNAKFITDFDSSVDKINIIPQEIGRVILNLINNAFYAVNERQKVEGAGYEPTVAISTASIQPPLGGRRVQIKVADNGGGIPQKNLAKIFQPFFTTKPTGQGTGLGLSLAYDIVKAHGGEIKVETKEGNGTEFIVWLTIDI